LGELERSTTRLTEAVGVLHEALLEATRERAPLLWATIQDNLGNALVAIGDEERDTSRLQEAVAAFDEALKERTRERSPLDWAGTQMNLGNALVSLGAFGSDRASVGKGIAAYRGALAVYEAHKIEFHTHRIRHNIRRAQAFFDTI
jgi:tetratricopeptide (TPR) repeat protein